MSNVDSKIEVNVPVRTAYNQWTQFEEFPRFMENIEAVEQMSDVRLHWVADIAGERKEWYARISRQVPDEVIAWESEGGVTNDGTIVFKQLAPDRTEIELHMAYDPEDFKEQVGGALGFVSRKVEGDLKRFKTFVEQRGKETGGWRGDIIHGAPNDEQSQLHLKAPPTGPANQNAGRATTEGRSTTSSSIRPETEQPTEAADKRAAMREAATSRPTEDPLEAHDTGEAFLGTAVERTEPGRDVPPTQPRP